MNYISPVKDTKFVLENLLNNPSAIEKDLMNSINSIYEAIIMALISVYLILIAFVVELLRGFWSNL